MWKKIIAGLVIVTFLVTVVLVPYSEAGKYEEEDVFKDTDGTYKTLTIVLGILVVVALVVIIAKKLGAGDSKKKGTTPEQPGVTPEKSTSSLPNFTDKIDGPNINGIEYTSIIPQNLPIEVSDKGVVLLKW